MQMFHTRHHNKIEVIDSKSDLILYDLEHGRVEKMYGGFLSAIKGGSPGAQADACRPGKGGEADG